MRVISQADKRETDRQISIGQPGDNTIFETFPTTIESTKKKLKKWFRYLGAIASKHCINVHNKIRCKLNGAFRVNKVLPPP